MEQKPPLPPFTEETAPQKVRMAEDAWNSRDPDRVIQVYTPDTVWRNRAEFPKGRDEVRAFLARKWARELDTDSLRNCGRFATTASRCASPTSGATTAARGFAPTATKTGSSTSTA
jgi:uncharacterized protein (TIGR02246 family)